MILDPIRADRLKAALRENLKRRKAQARARDGGEIEGGERVKNTTSDEDVAGVTEHISKVDDR